MKSYYQYVEDVLSNKIITGNHIKLAVKRFKADLEDNRYEFRESEVDEAIEFISTMKHFTGSHSNKPFILENWQSFIVANIVGIYLKGTDKRKYSSSYIEVSRKNGKALSLDTVIPTPTGFTTMGELKVGDYVLGNDGSPTKITFVTPTQYNKTCYKVTFEDGEMITADAEHQWQIKKLGSTKEVVLTTEDLLDFKRVRADGKGNEYKYRVPIPKPIELPEKDLPVDPYTLGLWLGDGSTSKPSFTVSRDDVAMYDCLIPIYGDYKVSEKKGQINSLTVSFAGDKGKNNSLLRHKLIEAGVFNNKHIPEDYLRSSKEQRLALLQGLMDTDGTVSKAGQCEFIQKSIEISDGLCDLLGSLGIKYSRVTKIPKCNGKVCDPVERITFYTDKTLPCFRLERKYDRLKDTLNKRMLYKSIINIEPTKSVPVRCITVDNKDSLYLCGNRYTVTHNSAVAAALCLYFLIADGEDGAEVLLAANSKEQAKISYKFASVYTKQLDPKAKYLKPYRDSITLNLNNSLLKVLAADSSKLDGYNCSFGLIDEWHSAPDSSVRDVIKSSMGMRDNPHLCTITTAGFDKTYPCFRLRQVGIEILSGVKTDESLFVAIYSLDEEDSWDDPKVWMKSNPNLGITVREDYLKEQVNQAKNNPAEEVGVKTKNLNIWVDSSEVWIPDVYILDATEDIDYKDYQDYTAYLGVDLGATSDLTAVSILIPTDDKLLFKTHYYLPESALEEKSLKETYKLWKQLGQLTITPGNVTDYDFITNDIVKIQEHLNIQKIFYDPYNATQWAINCTEIGLPLEPYSQNMANFNRPTKELERLILSKGCAIDNNEVTRFCFRNVTIKADHNGNVKPVKYVDAKKIDGVIANLMALGGYLTVPKYSNTI